MEERNLIFIISQPRSGSTYIQNLISNNSEVNTCSEPWILLHFANYLKPSLVEAKFDNNLSNRAFNEFIKKYKTSNHKEKLKEFILDLYQPLLDGHIYVVDKTPRYWEIIEEIIELFPESKIILLKRNPLDVAKSMIVTWRLYRLEDLLQMRRDLLYAPFILHANELKTNLNQIYSLRYEDLVKNPKEEANKLYKWLGIKFCDKVLNTSENKKYKGSFGDPYQNSKLDYEILKSEVEKFNFTKIQKRFLQGYAHYLGIDFLRSYGNYSTGDIKAEKTWEFKYYTQLNSYKNVPFNFRKEIKYLLKQLFYKIIIR